MAFSGIFEGTSVREYHRYFNGKWWSKLNGYYFHINGNFPPCFLIALQTVPEFELSSCKKWSLFRFLHCLCIWLHFYFFYFLCSGHQRILQQREIHLSLKESEMFTSREALRSHCLHMSPQVCAGVPEHAAVLRMLWVPRKLHFVSLFSRDARHSWKAS